jgi:hypothetical protein
MYTCSKYLLYILCVVPNFVINVLLMSAVSSIDILASILRACLFPEHLSGEVHKIFLGWE